MEALILVDLQYDFMPGGALAVPDGDAVVPIANQLMQAFDVVIATQDWHPPDHTSFAENHPGRKTGEMIAIDGCDQILWPVHCVQNSHGAKLHAGLNVTRITSIIQKGTNPRMDSYSAFFDNTRIQNTGLDSALKSHGVDRLTILGLATDYCVKFTVLDAISLGFDVTLALDGCRGVELNPGDVDRAIVELTAAGARIQTRDEILKSTAKA